MRKNNADLYNTAMLEIWVPLAIAAAFFQNLRSALQKHLKGRLSTVGAGYARFLYALPVALLYLLGLKVFGEYDLPSLNARFAVFCILGGASQILFTVCLLWMFSFQSFAVGTTFSKLEVIMVAILGALVLGDDLSLWAVVAITISAFGVVALTLGQNALSLAAVRNGLFSRATAIGLLCALLLGGSVVFFRGASLALNHADVVVSAAVTMVTGLVFQTLVMGGYLMLRERGELARVITEWRWAGAAGVAGALATAGWFTAFTIQNASHVRAVGQIELLFTFIATTVFFREKVSSAELVGIFMVCGGIVLLLMYG